MQYNIPRVAVDRTDELTDYEFDYELLLRTEFYAYVKSLNEDGSIDIVTKGNKAGFGKEMVTDRAFYANVQKMLEAGEKVDLGTIPDDSNVPRFSQRMQKTADDKKAETEQSSTNDDIEELDPKKFFGG
jgi:hypothetical protein